MITRICNNNHENHIDTFFKIAIFSILDLPYFNHLTSDANIETIFHAIPNSAQVLITDLLPQNLKVNSPSKVNSSGVSYKNNVSFLLTPEDKKLKELLETYQGKKVVIMLYKNKITQIIGTVETPLVFLFSPINSSDPKALKGYQIKMKGDSLGAAKLFEDINFDINFDIYPRGLAFELGQAL